jgi:hypothetical protein
LDQEKDQLALVPTKQPMDLPADLPAVPHWHQLDQEKDQLALAQLLVAQDQVAQSEFQILVRQTDQHSTGWAQAVEVVAELGLAQV